MATLQPVQFEVGGRKYSTIPLTGFDALDLDRIVADKWSGMHAAVAALGHVVRLVAAENRIDERIRIPDVRIYAAAVAVGEIA